MLKEQSRPLAFFIFALDMVLVAAAFVLAYWVRSTVLPGIFPDSISTAFYSLTVYLPLLPFVLLIWGALLLSSGCYRSHRTVPIEEEAWSIVRVSATALAVLALGIYAFRLDTKLLGGDEFSRVWVLLVALFACLLLITEKLAIRTISRYVRWRGYNYRTVLIVGTHEGAVALADSILDHRYWGFRIVGFVSHPEGETAQLPSRYELLGTMEDLLQIVEDNPVDDVLFCVNRRDLDSMEDLFLGLHEQGIRTRFALNLFPHTKARTHFEELDGVPLLTFSTAPERPIPLALKRLLDVATSAVLLFLALPVVMGIGLAIRLAGGGGDILYRQTRCGLNGRRFTLYKFRTMVADAEAMQRELLHLNEMNGPVFKLKRDPRVTWIGRFLRRFSLDELPQLWNVLRGDMSLVGPRPPIPDEVARYQRWQRRRLSMKPGLTCLWQISGRNQVDFDRWIELDLQYIDSWSPWLDMKILLKTVPAVLSGRGAS